MCYHSCAVAPSLPFCVPISHIDARAQHKFCPWHVFVGCRVKQGVIQFVFVKPFMAMLTLSIQLYYGGEVHWYHITEMIIYNFSYTIALYALVGHIHFTTLHSRIVSMFKNGLLSKQRVHTR